jgi:Mce-associated membrane protein
VTLKARAVGVGVVTASPTRVVAVVFIDQETSTRGSARTRQDQNRVLVTVTADGGEWRLSRMDAF